MKYTEQTYINLRPIVEEEEPIKKSLLPGFAIRRDALLDRRHQAARYAMLVFKTVCKALRMLQDGIFYMFDTLDKDLQHDREAKAKRRI